METKNAGQGHGNLKPIQSKDEARARGRAGGIRSGAARREKKMLSDIYIRFLSEKYSAKGYTTLADTVAAILARCDSASVSMLKEIREATEGSKVEHSGNVRIVASSVDERL